MRETGGSRSAARSVQPPRAARGGRRHAKSSTYAYGRAHAAVHDDTLTHGDTITSQMMKMMTIKCANTLLEDEPTRRDEAPVFHRFHARCACVASRQQRHRRQQAKHRVLKRAASASTLRHEARCATQRRADRERVGMSVLNDQRTTKGSRKTRHNRGIMGRDRDTTANS